MIIDKTIVRVIYADTDAMGIVYHSNYIKWFEVGRNEYLRNLGYTYDRMESEGVCTPVIEVECKYKSPARYDDLLRIETYIKKLGAIRFTIGYRIYLDENNELLVEGSSSHAWTSKDLKIIRIDKYNPDLYDKLKNCL